LLFLTQVQILWKEAAHDTNAVRTKIEIFTFEFLVSCWLLLIFILWKLQISNSKKMSQLIFLLLAFWNLLSLPRINSFSYSFLYFFRSFIFLYLFLSEVMFTNLFLFAFTRWHAKNVKFFSRFDTQLTSVFFYSNHFIFLISICLYLNHFILIISKVLL